MTGLSDSFQRPINYLRVSVTDRCNLRCVYCMPPEGVKLMPREDILTYEEVRAIVSAAAAVGITKVRITGGEPLVRADLTELVRMVAAIKSIDDISMTTNGIFLARHAAELKGAGLGRVNVSLDTLRPERFVRICRGGGIGEVLHGMAMARSVGLKPIKVNTVVMAGVNDDELVDFALKTLTEDFHVRFIELMPFGANDRSRFVPVAEMRRRIESIGKLEPCAMKVGNGPASYFRLPGARGTIGFITPITDHFCVRCNRLRLTADGKLRLCLMSDQSIDLRTPLRQGASKAQLVELFAQAVASKPSGHHIDEGSLPGGRCLSEIGG
ncbi:MAG: GTP 3',8-cyclase MoaA [Chloroflexi bacterium]|nr:GTP 3',8-cyclase MoaA [Chloroflexota bacterium]